MNDDQGSVYSFNSYSPFTGESHSFSKTFDEDERDVTWPEVLQAFLGFLSSVYGYDIKKHVAITDKPARNEHWNGPTWSDEPWPAWTEEQWPFPVSEGELTLNGEFSNVVIQGLKRGSDYMAGF